MNVTVKALEWGEERHVPDAAWSSTMLRQRIGHHNLGPFAGSYSIQEMEPGGAWGWWNTWTAERYPDGVEPTEEAAKAAAQADFDTRIRSVIVGEAALASPVGQAEGEIEERWRELCEKDDTSPSEYPNMALITFDEFAALSAAPAPPATGWQATEDAHVIAAIERELGSWECHGPDEQSTTVLDLIKAERAIFRASLPSVPGEAS